jgi:hypothetical protein
MAGRIYRFLAGDHARLDGLLERAITEAGAIDRAAYAEFRAGLLKHIGMEEKILLPAAQRVRGGEPLTLAAKVRLDHGALAALLVPTPTPVIIAALCAPSLRTTTRLRKALGGCTSAVSSWLVPRLRRCWPSCTRHPRYRRHLTPMVLKSWTWYVGRLCARDTMPPS